MSYTTTPNLGLLKPTVGGDDDAWGGHLNANADTLDTQTATKTYTDARRRRLLNAVTTSIPNVGANTSEEVAVVWTLPAGLLANAGDTMHIVVKTDMAGTTDTKVVRLRLTTNSNGLGGTQVASNTCNTATAVNTSWVLPDSRHSIRFASASLTGFPSIAPSMTTVVSAANTRRSRSRAATARAFASATRRT